MHTVSVDTSPWVHVSFSPVNLVANQTSVVSITAALPNIANGAGASGQAGYTCNIAPPIPVPISFDAMPESPNGKGNSGGGGPSPPCACTGKPVDVTTGEDMYAATDIALSGPFGLRFTRHYASMSIGPTGLTNSDGSAVGPTDLGAANWQSNYDVYVYHDPSSGRYVFHDEDGGFHFLSGPSANGGQQYNSISAMTFAINSAGTQWTISSFDNRQWVFNTNGQLVKLVDRIGNAQTVNRDATSGHNDRISKVVDPLGRELCFYYDGSNRTTELSWLGSGACPASAPTSGTLVKIVYDSGTNCMTGQLCSVTEPDGKTWTYQYASGDATFPNGLTEVLDPLGNIEEANTYAAAQVVEQYSGNCSGSVPCSSTGDFLTFSYANNGNNVTTVTNGLGGVTQYTYDLNTYQLDEISGPLCRCGGDQTRIYTYDGNERVQTTSDDGVNGSAQHSFTYTYGRDSGGAGYPGPTQVVENLDTSGTTRTTSYQYYPIGNPNQDLPQITTLPSVDKPGSTMSVNDTYATTGLLTQRTKTGYVNGTLTSYTWKWTYDSRGRTLTAVGPRTDVNQLTKYGYFSDTDSDPKRAGQLETLIDALSHVTTYSAESGYNSYDVFGNPQSMTDPNGIITDYTYDARGRLLASTLLGVPGDTANLTTTRTYDASGKLTKLLRPAGNAMAYSYDSSDRLTDQIRLDSGALQHERLVSAYNDFDQATSLLAQGCGTPAKSCASWSTSFSQTYTYTAATSDLKSVVNADKTTRLFGYEDAGQLSAFNDENHPTGSDYAYGYDVAARRLTETRKLGSGSVTASYTYDQHDNPVTVSDENGNTTNYHHDDFDRVTKETSPVQGVTTNTYDPDNDLISTTDANAATTTYTYDALDRELSEKAVKGSQTLTSSWTYDTAASGYYNVSRMVAMSDPSGVSTYGYDRRGNMTLDVHKDGSGNTFGEASTYDPDGNRSTITYPDGKILTYAYDFADRPSSVQQTGTVSAPQVSARLAIDSLMAREPSHIATEALRGSAAVGQASPVQRLRPWHTVPARGLASNETDVSLQESTVPERLRGKPVKHRAIKPAASSPTVLVSAASYEPFGPVDSITYGNTSIQTISYDDRYRVNENKLAAGATLDDHKYGLDAVGNITGLTDNLNSSYDRSFTYDDINRLRTANSGTSLWGTAAGNGYTYDSMGNLKTLQLGSTRSDTLSYLAGAGSSTGLPKLKSVVENGATRNVSYDAFGNELSDGKSTFTYSSRELLASDSSDVSTYSYDGFRRRTAATLTSALGGGTRETIFDTPTMHMLAETTIATGKPAIEYDYVWLGSRPVAQLSSSGTSWTYADQVGTPLIETNVEDDVTWQAEQEPYGEVWALRAGNVHQPLRFPGQVSEQFDTGANGASELSYNLTRWFRPGWGRYSEPDPIKLIGGLDLFRYAVDDPTVRTDRTGLSPGAFLHIPGYNYCGQHWTNGKDESETEDLPQQIGTVPPVNALDSCCLVHDRERSACWHNNMCDHKAECACKLRADRWLHRCAANTNVGFATYMVTTMIGIGGAGWTPEGCATPPNPPNPAPGGAPHAGSP